MFKVPPELNRIVYQDPVERKRRERAERIAREREEEANRKDPFAGFGQKPIVQPIEPFPYQGARNHKSLV